MAQQTLDRLVTKLDIKESGCWEFVGALQSGGYGRVWYEGKSWLAHRAVYTELVGPVSASLQLDHLCHNRRCCNPDHLEPVTPDVNVDRAPNHVGKRVVCKNGHEFTVFIKRRGGVERRCRECYNKRRQKYPRYKTLKGSK